jgi:hypothetical protein
VQDLTLEPGISNETVMHLNRNNVAEEVWAQQSVQYRRRIRRPTEDFVCVCLSSELVPKVHAQCND